MGVRNEKRFVFKLNNFFLKKNETSFVGHTIVS